MPEGGKKKDGEKAAKATAAREREAARAEAFFAADAKLAKFAIELDPVAYKALQDRPREFVRGLVKVTFPGQPEVAYKDVGVHLKGGPGSFRKIDDRPAFNLSFDKFVAGQRFHGLEKVLLNNSVQDPSHVSEALCGWIFREAGSYAGRATNARVVLNGKDLGPFVVKEGLNDPFLRKLFGSDAGDLYEGSFQDVDANLPVHYGKKVKPPTDPGDPELKKEYDAKVAAQKAAGAARLKDLVDACRTTDPAARREKLEKVLDVDGFLTFMACEVLTVHWDGYTGNKNNYRIYHNPTTGKLSFVAHGMDQMFQRPDYPLIGPANGTVVGRALLETPADRKRFLDRLVEIRAKVFTAERMEPEIDRLSARFMPLATELGAGVVKQHKDQVAALKDRVKQRIANVDRLIEQAGRPIEFDSSGAAPLAKQRWEAHTSAGSPAHEQVTVDKVACLKLKVTAEARGSWQLSVNLPGGKYVLEARVKATGVVPAGTPAPAGGAAKAPAPGQPSAGVGIGLRGGQMSAPVTGTGDWTIMRQPFEVTDANGTAPLRLQLYAKAGEVLFDVGSLRVLKAK